MERYMLHDITKRLQPVRRQKVVQGMVEGAMAVSALEALTPERTKVLTVDGIVQALTFLFADVRTHSLASEEMGDVVHAQRGAVIDLVLQLLDHLLPHRHLPPSSVG